MNIRFIKRKRNDFIRDFLGLNPRKMEKSIKKYNKILKHLNYVVHEMNIFTNSTNIEDIYVADSSNFAAIVYARSQNKNICGAITGKVCQLNTILDNVNNTIKDNTEE